MNNNGERFLDVLYKELFKSEEVLHTKDKKDTKEESIKKYMDRLEHIHSKANTENKKELVKSLYFKKYVIKKENLPFYLSDTEKEGIIEAQKKSLSTWIDYLTDENAKYPMWAKYWVFRQMLKMGTYDEINDRYTKRTKNTAKPFIEANPEIISKAIENITKLLGEEELTKQEVKDIISGISFEKIYIEYQKNIKEQYKSNEGIWIKYNEGDEEEAIRLSKSLEGYNTEWCTAIESTAIAQLCGLNGYGGGDFYVYYTKDEEENYKIPRIAIRLDGHTHIAEIRGVEEHQNLEEEMIPILETKLHEMTFLDQLDVYNNMEIVSKLKYLVSIKEKTIKDIPLTQKEVMDLYSEKFGFGWEQDPLVKKIINKRNPAIDYDLFKESPYELKLKYLSKIMPFLRKEHGRFLNEYRIIWELAHVNMKVLNHVKEDILNNKEFDLEMVKIKGGAIEYLDSFKTDNVIIQEAAKTYKDALKFANSDLLDNKEYMLEILKYNGIALDYASERLRNDWDICLTAVKQYTGAINFISLEIRENRNFVLEIVKKDGYKLFSFNSRFQYDREIVLEAVKTNGLVYQNMLCDDFRKDKEIAKEAVKENLNNINYVPEELKLDKEFVLDVLRNTGVQLNRIILINRPSKLVNDEEVILAAVKNDDADINLASPRLIEDRDFIIKCVHVNPYILKYLPGYINDREIVKEAVKKDVYALQFAVDDLVNDKDFVLEMIRIDCNAYLFRGEDIENDRDIALEAIKNSNGIMLFEIHGLMKIDNYEELFHLGIELAESEFTKLVEEENSHEDLVYFYDEVYKMIKGDKDLVEELNVMYERVDNMYYKRKLHT